MDRVVILLAFALLVGNSVDAQRRSDPALDSLRNEKDTVALQKKLEKLGNGPENELTLLMSYYRSSGKEAKADSIRQIAIKKYPNGNQAFIQYLTLLYRARGGKKQEEIFFANKDRFPNADLDQQYYSIAYAYAGDKDLAKVKKYVSMIKDESFRSTTVRMVTQIIKEYDLKAAEDLARPEVEKLFARGLPPRPAPTNMGRPDERLENYREFMAVYSAILIKNGKYEDAVKYAKAAYDASNQDEHLKSSYAILLSKTGKHGEALPILENIISSGKGGADEKQALKESYVKLNPGKDASAHLAQIEAGMKDRIEKEVRKMLISESAPNFVVKDEKGKTVSLSDFAGKTIVLDFWATWCGPCVKSFPAMQRVVNAYKSDPNVKFLFIHTWERVANPLEDAQAYLRKNNYRLDLYMDTKDPETKANPAVKAFGVSGIPAKFVIDGNGKICFKLTGFSGGDDAAVAELSTMINIAKKAG